MPNKKGQKTKKNPYDFILLITVLLLLALGITMVLSASSPSSLATTGNSYRYVSKQIFCAGIGIIAMLVLSNIDYKKYAKFYKIIMLISGLILFLVLVPGLGRTVNGARRWINLPLVSSFQPSELTKIGVIVFLAAYLTKHRDNLKHIWDGFGKTIIYFVLPIVGILLVVQSHLSASLVIIAVASVMMIVAGCRVSHFLSLGMIGGTIGGFGMYIAAKFYNFGAYRLQRLTSFLNPWADAQDSGWQIIQSLYAIGSGGLFGVGLRK